MSSIRNCWTLWLCYVLPIFLSRCKFLVIFLTCCAAFAERFACLNCCNSTSNCWCASKFSCSIFANKTCLPCSAAIAVALAWSAKLARLFWKYHEYCLSNFNPLNHKNYLRDVRSLLGGQMLICDGGIRLISWTLCDASQPGTLAVSRLPGVNVFCMIFIVTVRFSAMPSLNLRSSVLLLIRVVVKILVIRFLLLAASAGNTIRVSLCGVCQLCKSNKFQLIDRPLWRLQENKPKKATNETKIIATFTFIFTQALVDRLRHNTIKIHKNRERKTSGSEKKQLQPFEILLRFFCEKV